MSKDSRIHIVHIIPTLQFGGAERFVVDLVNSYNSDEFVSSIIVLLDTLPLVSEITADVTIRIVPKKGKISYGLIGALAQELQDLDADIVHTHLFGGDCWGRLAAKRAGKPVVTTEHNIVDEGWYRTIIKQWMRFYTNRYVAPSEAVAAFMRNHFRLHGPIDIVYHGIDTSRFIDIPIEETGPIIKFLMLGRLTEQKGQDIVLDAFAQIKNTHWQLSIVGNGEQHDAYIAQIDRLGLHDHVSVLPATTDVPQLFAKHDILLAPSRWEALGIGIIEAMAAGKMIIASHTGGIPELIAHNQNGLLVDAHTDIAAWVDVLTNVLDTPDIIPVFGARARTYVQKNHTLRKMTKEYESIYEQLFLAKKRYARRAST